MKNAVMKETALATIDSGEALDKMLDSWLDGDTDVRAITKASYRNAVKIFTKFLRSEGKVLNHETVKEYRNWLTEKPDGDSSKDREYYSTSTARNYFSICRLFLKWLEGQGICPNFASNVKTVKLKTNEHAHDALTLEEAAQVLDHFSGDDIQSARDKAILAVLLTCGLRTVEVIRLDVGDMERRNGVWRLKIWGKGRDGKDARVNLPDETKELIDSYLKLRGKTKKTEPLFTSVSRRNKGERLQRQTISRLAKNTFKAVGIESDKVVAHSCRNFAASVALDCGCSLDEVSKMLRHQSVSTTEIYRQDRIAEKNPATRIVASALFQKLKELVRSERL